ncbi:MAG: Phospholipase D-nuclease N-terminal [Verrucomicrobia bacterium]|nr:Phospholipase D-nuclease N-terminal [Verrucomicrobiota bacterium]
MVLAQALKRRDLDPVTKLMWVLVIILVPVFGVVFYGFIAPNEPVRVLGRDDVRVQPDEPIKCVTCQTTIPGDATVCPKCGWSYTGKT